MAFQLERFYSEEANVKSILGGVRYFKYFNKDDDSLNGVPGYFPDSLGLKYGDRVCVIPKEADLGTKLDIMYGVSDDTPGQVTVKQLS